MPIIVPLTTPSSPTSHDLTSARLSAPGGLEALYEYNGLVLNDKSVVDRYQLTEVTGLDDADIRAESEANPSDHGEEILMSLYGGRTITLRGFIYAGNLMKLRDMVVALKVAFADVSTEKALIIRHRTGAALGKDVQIYCRKSSSLSAPESWSNDLYKKEFLVTVRATNPRFVSTTETSTTLNFNSTTNITNNGSFEAQPKIELVGPLNALTIHNQSTGQIFKTKAAVPNGQTWTYDAAKRTFVDQGNVTVFGNLDITSTKFVIQSGVVPNVIYTDATSQGASSLIRIKHRDSYI